MTADGNSKNLCIFLKKRPLRCWRGGKVNSKHLPRSQLQQTRPTAEPRDRSGSPVKPPAPPAPARPPRSPTCRTAVGPSAQQTPVGPLAPTALSWANDHFTTSAVRSLTSLLKQVYFYTIGAILAKCGSRGETRAYSISPVRALLFAILFHFHLRNCCPKQFHLLSKQSRVLSPCQSLYFPSLLKNTHTKQQRPPSLANSKQPKAADSSNWAELALPA